MSDLFAPPSAESRVEPGSWSIHWDDYVLYEHEVTGAHLALLTLLHGEDSWANCDLSGLAVADPAIGPMRLMSWIIAMIADAEGFDDEVKIATVLQSVQAASAERIIGSLRRH